MLRNFFVYNILFTFNIITKIDPKGSRAFVACVASVSVRSIFLLFGGAKIGASATLMEGAGGGGGGWGGRREKETRFLSSLPLPLLALFCARPNFRAFKKRKICFKPTESPILRKHLLHRLGLSKKARPRCITFSLLLLQFIPSCALF